MVSKFGSPKNKKNFILLKFRTARNLSETRKNCFKLRTSLCEGTLLSRQCDMIKQFGLNVNLESHIVINVLCKYLLNSL
jgi:hypothetical protein